MEEEIKERKENKQKILQYIADDLKTEKFGLTLFDRRMIKVRVFTVINVGSS